MPNVVRFVLDVARDLHVPGVGAFNDGVLDVDANNIIAIGRARYLLQPYRAIEIGIVDSGTAPPTLPAPNVPPAPNADPYPQYLTQDESDARYLTGAAARGAFVPRPAAAGADGQALVLAGGNVVWGNVAAGMSGLIGLDSDGIPYYDPAGVTDPVSLDVDTDGVLFYAAA